MSTPSTGRLRWILIGFVAPLVVVAAGLLLMASWLGDLPDPVATHWPGPDGFGSVVTYFVLLPAVVVPFSVLMTAIAMHSANGGDGGRNPKLLVAFSAGLAVMLTIALTAAVGLQRGLTDARDAGDPGGFIALGAAAGIVVGVVIFLLVPAQPPGQAETQTEAPPALDLAPAERAYWSRTVSAGLWLVLPITVLVPLLVVLGVVVTATAGGPSAWTAFIAPVILVLVGLTILHWRVTVDESGFTARSLLGLPRMHVPLADVGEARAVEVRALAEFGGWGIRFGNNGRTGIILRSGSGLEVTSKRGRTIVVTIDDAASGAALLNGLAKRAAAHSVRPDSGVA